MDKKAKYIFIASIAAIVIACGLLAIPYFIVSNVNVPKEAISGYQFFFHAVDTRYETNSGMSGVSGLGIASIVVMSLALISYFFSRKSSAFLMLGGLLNVAGSVLFFAMEASKKHVYGARYTWFSVSFITYVIGAMFVITGLLSIYIAFRMMQSEKKDLGSKKSYSYLKK